MPTLKYISVFQLEEHIVRLRVQVHEQKEEIKYYQLETEKLNTLKEITDRQIEEAKAEWETLEKDMEENKRRHRVKIKVRLIHRYTVAILSIPQSIVRQPFL
ncbi:MAG: hypothetical protein ACRC31_02595 [Cetobacterium sp.]